jgi:hypothetical protein
MVYYGSGGSSMVYYGSEEVVWFNFTMVSRSESRRYGSGQASNKRSNKLL